jgi:hypothetical protein
MTTLIIIKTELRACWADKVGRPPDVMASNDTDFRGMCALSCTMMVCWNWQRT